jgi:hypothetical protein
MMSRWQKLILRMLGLIMHGMLRSAENRMELSLLASQRDESVCKGPLRGKNHQEQCLSYGFGAELRSRVGRGQGLGRDCGI